MRSSVAVALGSFRQSQPPEIRGSGYVVKSLEAALWVFHDADDFRQAVLSAVNLGEDADTTGAVCGQLAGAYWGESGIPSEWLDGLARRDMIETALAGIIGGQTQLNEQPTSSFTLASPTTGAPTVRCYWVVEDKLLAGAYPGSPDPSQHRERVESLWAAGICTFINLVEENETSLSGQPLIPYDDILRELSRQASERAEHLRFPIRDLSVPTVDGMKSILDAIDQSLEHNRPVYVHCFGGVGRTGTVMCCWLLRHGLTSPENVIQVLYRLRQADKQTTGRKAPETSEQIDFVRSWYEMSG